MSGALICLGCGALAHVRHVYLCPDCYGQLPPDTRDRLTRPDAERSGRIFQLLSALRRDVPLGKIQVAA